MFRLLFLSLRLALRDWLHERSLSFCGVLALASMVYPLIGEYAEIRPDFEHKVLRGRVYVRGRIRALHAAAFAMRLLADKNVKTTYRHIRKFKL